jgi:hypothetical protein
MAAPPPRPVLDTRRFGRTPLAFLVALGACCLVAVVALAVFVRGGPVPALTGLFLALLPVPVVLSMILYLDRLEPEPRALLAAMFGAGAGIAALVTADRRRIVGMITRFLPAFEDPAVVTAPDITMLASLRLRRLGRQWARLNLGIRGRRAMAEYQLAATELAMACNRNSLGRTTQEAFTRHRDDSLSLIRAAAAAVRAREPLYVPPWLGPGDQSAFVKPTVKPSGGEPLTD